MRRKITGMSINHYRKLLTYCVNQDFHIYQEWDDWLIFSAEVPDDRVETLREMDAAVNDDEAEYPTCSIKV